MATQQPAGGGDFIGNLGKIYGIYTGAFFAFVILLAILEQVGVPDRYIGYLFVGFTLVIYAGIGISGHYFGVGESIMFTAWAIAGLSQRWVIRSYARAYQRMSERSDIAP